jgi:hypothetical protein
VNEVMTGGGGQFVEVFDPNIEPFPFGPYSLVVYDAAGNRVGGQTLTVMGGFANPVPITIGSGAASADQMLATPLPTAAGQACFTRMMDAPISCMTWGCVSKPITSVGVTSTAQGAAPPDGQSLQRQPDGSAAVAAPTPKAVNTMAAAGPACPAGGGGGGGTADRKAPIASLAVAVPKLGRLISRGLIFSVRSNEAGRASATLELLSTTARKPLVVGSASVKIRRAGTIRLTVRLTRSAKTRLGRVSRARLRLRVTVTDSARNARKLTKALTSRR